MSALTKCECLHCGGAIEFEAKAAGQEFPCPHCGKKTWVDDPAKFSFISKQSTRPEPVMARAATPHAKENNGGSRLMVVILCVCALGLIGNGCVTDFQSKGGAGVVQFCTGFILLGLAAVLETLILILRK